MEDFTREIPLDLMMKYQGEDAPVFIAYGCVLLERCAGKTYVYKAVNLKDGRIHPLSRTTGRLQERRFKHMAEKIRLSPIAEAPKMQAEIKANTARPRERLERILYRIFEEVLPKHGYTVREAQKELSAQMFEAMCRRAVSFSEAGVGIGKTHAYLIAATVIKRGRVNDFWMSGAYPDMPYIGLSRMPVVISTSNIALQTAIADDYIPELSGILMEHGVIKTPLSSVVRKGKEHYVCDRRLTALLKSSSGADAANYKAIRSAGTIDLDAMSGIPAFIKRKVSVSGYCERDCPDYMTCRFQSFLNRAQSNGFDFQVCNHNYLLADIMRRAKGQQPLIPDYQAVIIDESHKFLEAARQMYGVMLSSAEVSQIADELLSIKLKMGVPNDIKTFAQQIRADSDKLFWRLDANIKQGDDDGETEHFETLIDRRAQTLIGTLLDYANTTLELLLDSKVHEMSRRKMKNTRRKLRSLRDSFAIFANFDNLVYWLEKPSEKDGKISELRLCSIPKNLNELLHAHIWKKEIPFILTSGTLSAAGSFEHIKRTNGVNLLPARRLMETSKASPFNYRENALIYISERVPFPDSKNASYISAVTDEIERLIRASHGHALVLFTSYRAMELVCTALAKRGLPFPMFRLYRNDVTVLSRFKASGNGVLFATGSLWEGIDMPGDILSMLIIVKLPFAVPDPISEWEKTLYGSFAEYKEDVLIPEMIVKLKQGFGRLIRLESDTGVVALLDSRVRKNSAYRETVLAALPECRVTASTEEVQKFIKEKKAPDYFSDSGFPIR